MKLTAPEERKIFWKIFEKKLDELNYPFNICYKLNGDIKYYAAINKKTPLVNLGLTVDFLYRDEINY